ncbi:MAG TPA: hypothetical protein VFL91_22455 [Thermomicrobiales bacterium]|nr:hypothetical protein [Thermomicrobiales bacterium]
MSALAKLPGGGRRRGGLRLLEREALHEGVVLRQHIREGRFQRSLALIAGFASILSGLEVAYEHYRGSYSQRVMYSPVLLSPALLVAAVWAAVSRRAARTALPFLSLLTILDGLVGFFFHIRGVNRKPGGWRIPVFNVIMGPPIFAPLLFGLSGYLGFLASLLRREDDPAARVGLVGQLPRAWRPRPNWLSLLPRGLTEEGLILEQHVHEGRFQKQIALVAGVSALFSGVEALYSHYKNNFTYRKLQWSPIVITPIMLAAGIGTLFSRTVARTLLPLASALALLDGALGFFYHARGVLRRPGGRKLVLYNTMYGPPIFAPLLFAASGFMGLLASLLRRAD